MGDNDRTFEAPADDGSFADFMDEIEPEANVGETTEEELEKPEEEVTEQEEDSQESEGQDEADEEDEDDSQEEAEEEADASQEEEEDDDEDDVDPRDSVIEQLKADLEALKKKVDKPSEEPPPEKEEPPELPEDLQKRIMGDLDLDDVTADPKLFMQVMQNALIVGRDMTYEHVMKSVPKLVIQQTKGYQDLMAMTRRFYKQNKDLRPYRNLVATAANEVHSENPDWGTEKVMSEAAKRARKTIGVTAASKKPKAPTGKKQTPAFAKTPKAKKVKAELSKLQKDINDTLDI